MLDPELLERPPDLGRMARSISPALVVEIMRAAVGIEGHRQKWRLVEVVGCGRDRLWLR
jgi:hypothetical protein